MITFFLDMSPSKLSDRYQSTKQYGITSQKAVVIIVMVDGTSKNVLYLLIIY
jgi:hypothetical protein